MNDVSANVTLLEAPLRGFLFFVERNRRRLRGEHARAIMGDNARSSDEAVGFPERRLSIHRRIPRKETSQVGDTFPMGAAATAAAAILALLGVGFALTRKKRDEA